LQENFMQCQAGFTSDAQRSSCMHGVLARNGVQPPSVSDPDAFAAGYGLPSC